MKTLVKFLVIVVWLWFLLEQLLLPEAVQARTVQFDEIPKAFNNCELYEPVVVVSTIGYDEPCIEARFPKLESQEVEAWWGLQTFRAIRNRRQFLTGILDSYSTFILAFDENDMGLNIIPDPQYKWMVDCDVINIHEDFDCSTVKRSKDKTQKVVHCELTPDESLYDNLYFLRIASEEQHGSPLEGKRIGLYGVFAGDYGHKGHPEIHPFDAILWGDWQWSLGEPGAWSFRVFKDESDRFNYNWSRAPRAITFYFPFSVELPSEEGEKLQYDISFLKPAMYGGSPTKNIEPYFPTSSSTTECFPNHDPPPDGHFRNEDTWLRIVENNGREILISIFEGHQGWASYWQNVGIENLYRCGRRIYATLRVSVAVGQDGYYIGKIDLRGPIPRSTIQSSTSSTTPSEWEHTTPHHDHDPPIGGDPRRLNFSVNTEFVGSERDTNQSWHHYHMSIELENLGLSESTPIPSPNELVIAIPDLEMNFPFDLGDIEQNVIICKQRGVLPEQCPGEWALRVVAGTYEKQRINAEGDVPAHKMTTRWRFPVDFYINPNVMTGTSYPSRFRFVIKFPKSRQLGIEKLIYPVEGEFFISQPKVPYMKFDVSNIQEPRSIVERGHKALEFRFDVEATPKNLSPEIRSWNWQSSEQRSGRGISINKGTGNRIQFTTRLGDADVYIRAQTQDADGVSASGLLHLPGVRLSSGIVVVEDAAELFQIPALTDNLKHETIEVPLTQLIPESRAFDSILKPTFLQGTTPIESRNIMILRAIPHYSGFRNGEIYGEEEYELAERLNKIILFGSDTDSRSSRLRIFGSEKPLTFQWHLTVQDLKGDMVPVKLATKPLEEVLKESQLEQTALLFHHDLAQSKDIAILVLPRDTPCSIDGKVTVSDPFRQSFTRKIKAYNYRIPNVAAVIQSVAGLDTHSIDRFFQEASRKIGLAVGLSRRFNPFPEQPGYSNMLELVRDELDSERTQSIPPYEFQRLLRLVRKVHEISTPSQRALLFNRRHFPDLSMNGFLDIGNEVYPCGENSEFTIRGRKLN